MKKSLFLGVIWTFFTITTFCQNNPEIDNLNYGTTKLINAITKGYLSKVDSLLQAGANPNTPDSKGNTPLIYCAWQDDIYSAKLLIEKGANVNYMTKDSSAAIIQAAAFASDDFILLLLDNNANPNTISKVGTSPLFEAIIKNNFKSAEVLLAHGADPDFTLCGIPIICTVVSIKDTSTAKLLMKYSVKLDVPIQQVECTPPNASVGINALKMAEGDENLLAIFKMRPSDIKVDCENWEGNRTNQNFTQSLLGRIYKIEGKHIQFETGGAILVLHFNNKTKFKLKQGQTFVNVSGPEELKTIPLLTVEYSLDTRMITQIYEGAAIIRH